MQNEITISNFQLLNNIGPGTKLIVNPDTKELSSDDRWFQGIRRKYQGDTRNNILKPIRETFETIVKNYLADQTQILQCSSNIRNSLLLTYPDFPELMELIKNIEQSAHDKTKTCKELADENIILQNLYTNLVEDYTAIVLERADLQFENQDLRIEESELRKRFDKIKEYSIELEKDLLQVDKDFRHCRDTCNKCASKHHRKLLDQLIQLYEKNLDGWLVNHYGEWVGFSANNLTPIFAKTKHEVREQLPKIKLSDDNCNLVMEVLPKEERRVYNVPTVFTQRNVLDISVNNNNIN